LGKSAADDELLLIETILDANGLDDALWCLRDVDGQEREMRLYAVWCARRVQHLMLNPASVSALDVAERYARGRATDDELEAARATAARATAASAAETTADWAAWAAAWAARAEAAVGAEAGATAAAAVENERSAQAQELRRICREIEAGRDPYPEEGGR
jgi:hypothetical protein